MYWPMWAKRSRLEMNFHYAFVMFDTTAQSAWLLWLAGPGVKRGGIAPQGTVFARREKCIHTRWQLDKVASVITDNRRHVVRGHVYVGRQNELVICIAERSKFPFSDKSK
jgi:hypothetical protein